MVEHQEGGEGREQSHADVRLVCYGLLILKLKPKLLLQIRYIVELLAGRQNPTTVVHVGQPPRRTFTTQLRVPGLGVTHKEWFVEKTRQWMEDKQVMAWYDKLTLSWPFKVTSRDVIWSQLYLDMREVCGKYWTHASPNIWKINELRLHLKNQGESCFICCNHQCEDRAKADFQMCRKVCI